jgi:fatty acid desaturase
MDSQTAAVEQLYQGVFRDIVPARRKGFYLFGVGGGFLMLLLVLSLLTRHPNLVRVLLLGLAAGFLTMRLGFLAHDISHGAAQLKPRQLALVGDWLWDFVLGVSHSWWHDKHQTHHANPNVGSIDPDLYTLMTYTEEVGLRKKGILGFIARNQAPLFPLMVGIFYVYFQGLSALYLMSPAGRKFPRERWLLAAHHVLLLGYVFWALPPLLALAFLATSWVVTALYMGLTFAPNHIGMPIIEVPLNRCGVREQLEVTRNVRASPFVDWVFAGLNYQIEHHLFPTMPRYQHHEASKRVQEFCRAQGLPYHVTSITGAFGEIFRNLHEVGAPARKRQAGLAPHFFRL